MNQTRKRVSEIFEQMDELRKELDSIQKTCAHKNTYIGNYSYRVGVIEEYHICEDCEMPIHPVHDYEFGFNGGKINYIEK